MEEIKTPLMTDLKSPDLLTKEQLEELLPELDGIISWAKQVQDFALNQAIKAIAIARGFVAPSGKNLVCIPAFTDIVIDGEERTAIKLIVEAR